MKHSLSLSEIVDRVPLDGGVGDVVATADAHYEAAQHELSVLLGTHVCPEDTTASDRHLHPEWLPAGETVKSSVDSEEAGDMARDVFHSWVKRVRAAAAERH